ncbi:MAG: hypothetical protein RL385_2584 [Pseudomonadota bacterium]
MPQQRLAQANVTRQKASHTRTSQALCLDVSEPSEPSNVAPTRSVGSAELAALRRGEPRAFEQVYEAYRARLYTFLLRLCRDEQLARDLSQETWLRLAAHATRLAEDSELGAWLYSVARNLYISRRRWSLRDRERLLGFGLSAADARPATPLCEAQRSELSRRLERAIAALPLACREVLLLVCIEGFSTEAVARMLALDPAAVRKRLSRARNMLRAELDAHDAGVTR